MSARFAESVVEDAALGWLGELKYSVLHGPEIAPGELAAEYSRFLAKRCCRSGCGRHCGN